MVTAGQKPKALNATPQDAQRCPETLRVQVPTNHILTKNVYYNYYYRKPKYLIIGYLPLGKVTTGFRGSVFFRPTVGAGKQQAAKNHVRPSQYTSSRKLGL